MVEVFKTNVKHPQQASMLIDHIKRTFSNYEANFDLQDCDNILRVKCSVGLLKVHSVIRLVHELGFKAEILPDEPVPFTTAFFANGTCSPTDN